MTLSIEILPQSQIVTYFSPRASTLVVVRSLKLLLCFKLMSTHFEIGIYNDMLPFLASCKCPELSLSSEFFPTQTSKYNHMGTG